MSPKVITQGNVYGSTRDSKYRTNDLHAAEAHEFIYSAKVVAWVRERIKDSGRFTSNEHMKGEEVRQLELLHEFETLRRKGTPVDHFGIDHRS